MPENPRYPTITDATLIPLRAIEIQYRDFPDILDRADCPYTPTIKMFLRKAVLGLIGDDAEMARGIVYSDQDTLQEISDLFSEIKRVAFVGGRVAGAGTKEDVAALKSCADLLTKMVDLKAKAFSVRDMGQFQKAVVDTLEGMMTPAQRSEFIERLGAYV